MKERLTKRLIDGSVEYENEKYVIRLYQGNEHCYSNEQKGILKLAEYEDLEEQGLILRLPHKIGDEVTFIDRFCLNFGLYERAIKTGTIVEIGLAIAKEGQIEWHYIIERYDRVNDRKSRYFCPQENLFISKEEAEKKLAELKGVLNE